MKKYNVTVNGTAYEITLEVVEGDSLPSAPAEKQSAPKKTETPASGETVKAPMPGNILAVNVENGANVKKGDVLLILEAMKMENEIVSPCDGTVSSIVSKGASVETGTVLCVID